MHCKFINRGMGNAKDALKYLLQLHDHKGVPRADIKVLHGNPQMVTELADSLTFKHRYRSAVIAWHKDDNPIDEQIAEVLKDFERVSFAGLEPNQYAYYAVQHEDTNGAKHLHIIVPRVELTTGKSFNIAPPNWQKTYDVFRDMHNVKNGWASPKDSHRRKLSNTKPELHLAGLQHTKAKIEIKKNVGELVAQGILKNEVDVMRYLATTGLVKRRGKSISLTISGINKNIKLNEKDGLAYAKGFDAGKLARELKAEQKERAGQTKASREREYGRIHELFTDIICDRAKFNKERYGNGTKGAKPQQQDTNSQQQKTIEHDGYIEPKTNQDKSQALGNTNSYGLVFSVSPSGGYTSDYSVFKRPNKRDSNDQTNDNKIDGNEKENEDLRQRKKDLPERGGILQQAEDIQKGSGLDTDRLKKGLNNDTARARVTPKFARHESDAPTRAGGIRAELKKYSTKFRRELQEQRAKRGRELSQLFGNFDIAKQRDFKAIKNASEQKYIARAIEAILFEVGDIFERYFRDLKTIVKEFIKKEEKQEENTSFLEVQLLKMLNDKKDDNYIVNWLYKNNISTSNTEFEEIDIVVKQKINNVITRVKNKINETENSPTLKR